VKTSSIPVLTYHRVAAQEKIDPQRFEIHLRTLAASGLRSLLPGELSKAHGGYVLTFDDAFADLWTTLFPRLLAYGIKAVVFVIPARTGDGPPRPQGRPAFSGTANQAHQAAAESNAPHSAFLRWSELAAMEASGLVQAQSHAYQHAMGWISDTIQRFHLPPAAPGHWSLGQCTHGDVRAGIPLYLRGSALAHRLYHDDPRLRDHLAAWLAQQGDAGRPAAATAVSGLRKALFEQVAAFKRSQVDGGRWETEKERRQRTLAEMTRARAALVEHLGGRRDELCLPWGQYDGVTLDCAREAGIQRIYGLERGSNPTGRLGWIINRFEPRPRGALWLKSRLWIYRSRIRSAIYCQLSRRRKP
jgi:peptidoglycan/xylan/chitin deacetylase (PgdA/CDA1 family)